MTEPHGEQKELTQEDLDKVTKVFEDIVKEEVNTGHMEFTNKDITALLIDLTPTLIKFETALHALEARVKALEN